MARASEPWRHLPGSGGKAGLSSAALAGPLPGGLAAPLRGLAGGTASASPASGPSSASGAFHFPSGSQTVSFSGRLSPKGRSCGQTAAGSWLAEQGLQLLPVYMAGPGHTGWKVSSAEATARDLQTALQRGRGGRPRSLPAALLTPKSAHLVALPVTGKVCHQGDTPEVSSLGTGFPLYLKKNPLLLRPTHHVAPWCLALPALQGLWRWEAAAALRGPCPAFSPGHAPWPPLLGRPGNTKQGCRQTDPQPSTCRPASCTN